jgi:hypothetical protein
MMFTLCSCVSQARKKFIFALYCACTEWPKNAPDFWHAPSDSGNKMQPASAIFFIVFEHEST